jgi:ATP-dependent Clp protease, protease subunit
MMTNKQKPWTFTAKAAGELEILLYSEIGDSFFEEGTTAKQFDADLKAAGNVSRIRLRVNSGGGDVFQGIAIYNTLLQHPATVTAQVDGVAASIASVIICAASEISIASTGFLMVHNPATIAAGDERDFRAMAETLSKVKTAMVTAYRRHTPLSTQKIAALLDDETWMTAQEAVDNGFAETVMTPEGDDADIAAHIDLSKFRNVPQPIAARLRGGGARSEPDAGINEGERLRLAARARLALQRRLPDSGK